MSKVQAKVEASFQKSGSFAISLPEGAEQVAFKKSVIKGLLQQNCNLEIDDFHIEGEDDGKQSFVLIFKDRA